MQRNFHNIEITPVVCGRSHTLSRGVNRIYHQYVAEIVRAEYISWKKVVNAVICIWYYLSYSDELQQTTPNIVCQKYCVKNKYLSKEVFIVLTKQKNKMMTISL